MAPRGKSNKEAAVTDTKPSNPKDQIGVTKLPMHLVPDSMKVFAALAFLEGDLKYGGSNWRVAGVRASVYRSALDRHLAKWWNGENKDPHTGIPHLASVLACVAIILDAEVQGRLVDDRPPGQPLLAALIDTMPEHVAKLKELFKDYHPKRYTIADSGVTTE
jgi:hypothetical protein